MTVSRMAELGDNRDPAIAKAAALITDYGQVLMVLYWTRHLLASWPPSPTRPTLDQPGGQTAYESMLATKFLAPPKEGQWR